MTAFANLLATLLPGLLALTLGCAFAVLIVRCMGEPAAPGIEFKTLVRRLVDRKPLETDAPQDEAYSPVSRKLRRQLEHNRWAAHEQWRILLWVACVMLVSRLLILAAAMVGSLLTGSLSRLFTAAISHWVRWDASRYIDLAHNGYNMMTQPELLAFLPLYPLLVRIVATLCFGHYVFAGFLVSNASLLMAGWCMYHLVVQRYGETAGKRAVMLLMFAPMSLSFSVPYAESLFLALTLGSLLAAQNKRFITAVILGALSAATRLIGALVIVPLLIQTLRHLHQLGLRNENKSRWMERLLGYTGMCLLVFVGTGTYLLVNQIVAGNPFAFVDALKQSPYFQSFGSIVNTLRYSIEQVYYNDLPWQLGTWIPQVLLTFAAAVLILTTSASVQPEDGMYALLYLALTMAPSWMLSGVRSITSMYAFYIMLVIVTRKNKWSYPVLIVLSIAVTCFFSYFYALMGTVV